MDCGGMAERTKAAVLKTAIRVTVSWVRIPLPPPALRLVAGLEGLEEPGAQLV